MAKVTVVVADDHPLMRMGICNLLNRSGDIQVIGEAVNGQQAICQVNELKPDILIMDMEMPDMDGVEVARELRQCNSSVRILVLSAYNDRRYIEAVLEHGAAGYLTKDEAPESITSAVHDIAAGTLNWINHKICPLSPN